MNELDYRDVIERNKEHLIRDLYYDIIMYMTEKAFDKVDAVEVLSMPTPEEQARLLLEKLTQKYSRNEFEIFRNALKIDYGWLYDQINVPLEPEEEYGNVLIIGGVPPLPSRNVTRSKLLKEVRKNLFAMRKSNQFLTLHGLIGGGKMSLASHALHDPNIVKKFNNIFWLTVSSDTEENLISNLQSELNMRLPNPITDLSKDLTLALIQLRNRYAEWLGGNKHCLIILAGVSSAEFIKYLNVGVQYLITTQDTSVCKAVNGITTFIKVDDGFEESESLSMFAKSLGIKISDLTEEPKKIHRFCKGHPFSVSIIAGHIADHQEAFTNNSEYWSIFLKQLKEDKNTYRRRSFSDQTLENIYNTIKIAIDNLIPRHKNNFESFVVFIKDINLKPEVLAIFWCLTKLEVEVIMNEFVRKSLAVKKWNQHLNSYVYGIHDLFLDYLNSQLSQEKISDLHELLLKNYSKACLGNFSRLPVNDNYIFYYLGHHLKACNKIEMFSKLYFDLEFLEAKLLAVETSDVVRDFKNYKSYIKLEANENEVEEIKSFIEWYGPSIQKGMDIAQVALQEDPNGFIYKKGIELAKKRSKKLYIKFPLGPVARNDCLTKTITFQGKKSQVELAAVRFSKLKDYIIIGRTDGLIQLWTKKDVLVTNLCGHTKRITRLYVHPAGHSLISASIDGTAKEWNLEYDIEISSGERTPSPEETQGHFVHFWNPFDKKGHRNDFIRSIKYEGPCLWAASPNQVANKLLASVWSDNEKTTFISLHDFETFKWNKMLSNLRVCEFSHDDCFIFCGGAYGIEILDVRSMEVKGKIIIPDIIGLCPLPGSLNGELLTISKNRVDLWENTSLLTISSQSHTFERKTETVESEDDYVTCHIDEYVALVTKSKNVLILDRETGVIVDRISGKEDMLDVAVKNGLLMIAYPNSVDIKPIDNIIRVKSGICWTLCGSPQSCVSVLCDSIKIQVLIGRNLLVEKTEEVQITHLALCCDKDRITLAYGTVKKEVKMLIKFFSENVKHLELINHIFVFDDEISVLQAFQVNNDVHIVSGTYKDYLKASVNNKIRKFQCKGTTSTEFIKNQNKLITFSNSVIQIWNFTNAQLISCFENVTFIGCTIPESLASLVVLQEGKSLLVRDIARELDNIVLTMPNEGLIMAKFSPDGSKILLIFQKQISVHDFKLNVTTKYEVPDNSRVICAAVTNSGVVCIATKNSKIIIYKESKIAFAKIQLDLLVPHPVSSDAFAGVDKFGVSHIFDVKDYL